MKPTDNLAACLAAAQADAERYYGNGPAPRWRPANARKSWLAVAVLVVVATAFLGWSWRAPDATSAPVAAAATAAAPIAAPAVEAPAVPARALPFAPVEPVAVSPPWQGADADAWALDPQSIAVPPAQVAPRRLHNTPVVVDEVAAAVEADQDAADQGGGLDE